MKKSLSALSALLILPAFLSAQAESWNDRAMEAHETGAAPEKVVSLLEQGVQAGETEAMVNLAGFTAQGRGTKQDPLRAVALLKQAADKGNALAAYHAGMAYYFGTGTEKDEAQGRLYLRKAADAGNPDAHYALGNLAEYDHNIPEAMKEYLAAGKEHDKAMNRLGILTYLYEKDPKSDEHALKYFLSAAFRKHAPALNNAAYVLTHRTDGKAPDWKMAESCYKQAAEQHYAPALFNLGNLYFGAAGSEYYKPELAVKYLQEGAEKKHSGSLYLLGTAYRNGDGVKQDLKKAVELYRLSADRNFAFACIQLAEMYESGTGVEKDSAQAAIWRKKAEDLLRIRIKQKSRGNPAESSMQSEPVKK